MLNIEYKRGMRQAVIETATFNLENEKQLIFSVVDVPDMDDPDKTVAQNVIAKIRDNSFGEEELFVEICMKDGIDMIRILQRLFRQVANFDPNATKEQENA